MGKKDGKRKAGPSASSEIAGTDREKQYDSVVILGNIHYKQVLNKLAGPKVKVVIEEELSPLSILEVVKKHKNATDNSEKTLWILTTGIYSICEVDTHPGCKSCNWPVNYIFIGTQPSEEEIAAEVQDILYNTNKVCMSIQDELDSGGTIVIVPPVPATVVQEAAFKEHGKLHKVCQKNHTSCASDAVLFKLHIFFNILCDAWSSLASEWLHFGQPSIFSEFQESHRGMNLVPIKNEDTYEYVEQEWITMLNNLLSMAIDFESKQKDIGILKELEEISLSSVEVCTRTNDPSISYSVNESMSYSVNESMDQDSDAVNTDEASAAPENFKHCVVVGSSNFFSQLKEIVKDLPVSFLEKSMDMDEEGLNILKEEKKNFPKNTIWLIVRGVSEIAELTDDAPKCAAEFCDDPLYVFVLKNKENGDSNFRDMNNSDMIDSVVNRAVDFAVNTSKSLHLSSSVFLAPIIPVAAYFGGSNSAFTHTRLHNLADNDPCTPILAGKSKEWLSCVQELEKKWMHMIMDTLDQTSPVYSVLKNKCEGQKHLLVYATKPGHDSRLAESQRKWGHGVRSLISVLLGLEDASQKLTSVAKKPATVEELFGGVIGLPEPPVEPGPTGVPVTLTISAPVTSVMSAPATSVMSAPVTSVMPAPATSVMSSFSWCSAPVAPIPSPIVPAAPCVPTVKKGVKGRKQESYGYKASDMKQESYGYKASDKKQESYGYIASDKKQESYGNKAVDTGSCEVVIKNVNNNIRHEHIKQILEACGSVTKVDFPISKVESRFISVTVKYNNPKSAKRSARILNFLKVLGKNSTAQVSKQEIIAVRELFAEDRLIIPIIQDVIMQMQKAKAPTTQVSIVAKKQTLPPPPISDSPTETPKKEVKHTPKPVVKTASPVADGKPKRREISPSKPTITVTVSNLSEFVSVDVIKELMRACGSLNEGDVKRGEFNCQLQDIGEVTSLVTLMNNFRFPDVKLKVYTNDTLDLKALPTKLDENIKNQVNIILREHNDDIVNKLREVISKDINYYTFKTQLCNSFKCRSHGLCSNYHNIKDRRRSPITCVYSSSMCGRAEWGECKEREACSLSHTVVDQQFHLSSFRATLCEDAVKRGVCSNRNSICPHAHPETPEMFFHKCWENLYVEGLGETFKFLNGAIKNMFKLQNCTDMQVVVITSTFEMVQMLVKTVQYIAKACRQTVVSVSQYGSVANDGTILISTPLGLTKMLKRKEQVYDLTKVKAIIIDDGLKVFTEVMNAKDEKLTNLLVTPGANKVVVDDKVSEGKVGVAANLMKGPFKMLPADRPKKKWEPLVKIDADDDKQEDTEDKKDSGPIEKVREKAFKVPIQPIPKVKSKENSDGSKKKDSTVEKSEKNLDASKHDGQGTQTSNEHQKDNSESKQKIDALKQLMSNYKDFKKMGISTEASRESSKDKGSPKMRSSRWDEGDKTQFTAPLPKITLVPYSRDDYEKPKSTAAQINKNLVPYFSLKEKSKSYASIPFTYSDNDKPDKKDASNTEKSSKEEKDVRNLSSASRWDKKSPESSRDGRRSPDRSPTSARGSKRSPTSKDSRRTSPSRDSRRSSPSRDSERHTDRRSPSSRDSRRSPGRRTPSTDDAYSRRRRSPSPYSRSRYNNKKSYMEAEMDLKEDHIKESKLFLDVPEVHPEFENKYKIFSDRYQKQYVGKIDSKHKEQRWLEFWKVVVTGMQELQWKEKVDMLKRQFRMDEPKKKDDKESKSSTKRKQSDSREEKDTGRKSSKKDAVSDSRYKSAKNYQRSPPSHRRDYLRTEESRTGRSRSPVSNRGRSRTPVSRRGRSRSPELNRGRSKSPPVGIRVDVTSQKSKMEGFSMTRSLKALGDACHLLGVLSPALKEVIEKVNRAGIDSKESIAILTENDNALLLEMCTKRFDTIKKSYKGPQKRKLSYAQIQSVKLQEYAAFKLKEFSTVAADNAVFSQKEEKPKDLNEPGKKVRGIDVNKIARATHEKGTEATIEFIKNAFAYEGVISPTTTDINEIYVEVSRIHFQMTLSGVSSAGDSPHPQGFNSGHPFPQGASSGQVFPQVSNSGSEFLYGSSLVGNMGPSFPLGSSMVGNIGPSFPPGSSIVGNMGPSFPPPGTSLVGNMGTSFPPGSSVIGNMGPSISPGSSLVGNVSSSLLPGSSIVGNMDPSLVGNTGPSFQPGSSSIGNVGPSFPSGSSLQDDYGTSFPPGSSVQDNHGSSFQDNHGSSFHMGSVLRDQQSASPFQHQDWVDKEQDDQSRDSRGSGNQLQQWNKQQEDESTIDFMNERLDVLLRDAKLQSGNKKNQPSQKDNILEFVRKERELSETQEKDFQGSRKDRFYDDTDFNRGGRQYDTDFNRGGRQYKRNYFENQQRYNDNDDDDGQRHMQYDRGNNRQRAQQYGRSDQYQDEHWNRSDDTYDADDGESETRHRQDRHDGDSDNDLDFDNWRNRDGNFRGSTRDRDNEWGGSSRGPMQRGNQPSPSYGGNVNQEDIDDAVRLLSDSVKIQELLTQFR